MHYPEELLKCEYDPDLTIRGLHYDIVNGLLIKVNSVLQIQSDAVFRGRKQLSDKEVAEIYKFKRLTLEELEPKNNPSHFVHLVDNFAKPVMCLLADVVQWFLDNGIDYEPESIYTDVRVSLKIDFSSFAKELRTKSCHSRQSLTKLIPFFTWTSDSELSKIRVQILE